MERNKRKDQGLQILHKIVEHPETFRVRGLGHVHQRADFGGLQKHRKLERAGSQSGRVNKTHFERDVLIPQSDLQFLTSVLVLLRPFRIVLPASHQYPCGDHSPGGGQVTYFKISLSLMMRFTSWIIAALTHTEIRHLSVKVQGDRSLPSTHSLCGSGNHCGNSNCSHTAQRHCVRRRECESQILSEDRED